METQLIVFLMLSGLADTHLQQGVNIEINTDQEKGNLPRAV